VFEKIKNNWKSFIPLLALLLSAVGAAIGVKLTIKTDPNAKQPEVIVIVPENSDPLILQAKAGNNNRPVLTAIAKVRAAKLYAAEKDISFLSALTLARHVPDEQISAAAKEAGLSFESVPVGGPIKDLLDWMAANPEFVAKLIQIILTLVPLFA